MRRGLLRAGLLLTAPCVVLLVALPVGFVMELGKQVRLRIVNNGDIPLRVTVLGVGRDPDSPLRVAALTLHPLLPIPAFRAVDIPIPPQSSRTLLYSARQVDPRLLALRDHSGTLRDFPLPAARARRDVETGREVILHASTPQTLSTSSTEAALAGHSQLLPWAGLLAGPLGTLGFLLLRRELRRPSA